MNKMKNRPTQAMQASAKGRKKTPPPSTQAWLPFSDIQGGYLLRRDGLSIGALRVQPVNFGLLSEREQKSLILRYFEVKNGLDRSFQYFCVPRPIDLDGYIAWLRKLRDDTKHRIRQRVLAESIRETAELAASGRAVDRQFYLVVAARKQELSFRSALESIAREMSNAGLKSQLIDDAAWRELWVTLMHPRQAAFERAPQKMADVPFIETPDAFEAPVEMERVQGERKSKRKIQAPSFITHFLDVVAPMGLQFPPRHIEYGDVLTRTLVIMHYPAGADRAWLSRISTMPGVILSLHAEPTNSFELTKRMEVSIGELTSKIQTGKALEKEQAKEKKSALEKLFKKLDQEQQRVFFVTIVLMVVASELQRLDELTREVESRLSGQGMRGRIPVFFQHEALTSLMPVGLLEEPIRQFGQRNMPAESLAASFPFVYSGLNDGRGVMLGMDNGGGIVLCDFWKRAGSRVNSNGTIIGRPGVGKSSFVKKLMIHAHAQGAKIIVIDPEREYKDLCTNLGGDWIDCGCGTANSRINPLQVRSVPFDEEEEESQGRGSLSLHFQTLRGFFQYYLRQATREHMGLLEIAWEDVYEEHGINWETTQAELRKREASSFPHVGHLHAYAEKRATESIAWRELALMLRPAAVGADRALWAGETSIRSESDFVCLDIHQLLEADEGIRRAQFFNVLGYAWHLIEEDRSQPVILISDETYLVIDPEHPQALQFLRNTSKRIRKYGGGLWVITHSMIDFLDPAVQRYGQALVDNPSYKMIMGQGEKDLEALEKLMHLSEAEQQLVEKSERGHGLFVAGDQRLHLKVELTELEMHLMGTAGGR